MQSKYFPFILLAAWSILAIFTIGSSLYLCEGNLVYSLDDPYIHMAVAENIIKGGYGINYGEYSAPSSSIAWPLILTLTEIPLGIWGPLVLNILAMGCAVFIVGRIIQDHVLDFNQTTKESFKFQYFQYIFLGLLLCLVMNAWGLVMTGMEHSLHVLAVVLIFWRLLELVRKRKEGGEETDRWLIAGIVIVPLIRFEGLAMALFTIAALLYLRERRTAIICAILIVSVLLTWSGVMLWVGLPVFPSSVLLKSSIAADMVGGNTLDRIASTVLRNFMESVGNRQGTLLLLGIIFVGGFGYKRYLMREKKDSFILVLVVVSVGLSHIFFGSYGWFSRYEVYVLALTSLAAIVLIGRFLILTEVRVAVLLTVLVIGAPYFYTTILSPLASKNIYEQQYQMHRFATEYWKQPIAVNDLGWVSYRNPAFVLDLWGLGSEEVRKLRLNGRMDADAIESIVKRRNVGLAMIYDEWFQGHVPSSWTKIAVLNTKAVSAGGRNVSFYATSDTDSITIRPLLKSFSETLPPRARLIFKLNNSIELGSK